MFSATWVIYQIIIGCCLDRQIRCDCKSFIVQLNDIVMTIFWNSLHLGITFIPFYIGRWLTIRNYAWEHQVLIFLYIYFVILFRHRYAVRWGFDFDGRRRCWGKLSEICVCLLKISGENLFERKGIINLSWIRTTPLTIRMFKVLCVHEDVCGCKKAPTTSFKLLYVSQLAFSESEIYPFSVYSTRLCSFRRL